MSDHQMDRLARVLSRFERVSRLRPPSSSAPLGHYEARCPNHDDWEPSLSIRPMPDGGITLHCFGPCTFEQIVTAAGVDRRDLRPDSAAWSPALPPRRAPVAPAPVGRPTRPTGPSRQKMLKVTWYDVRDAGGTVVACHKRVDWLLTDGTTEKDVSWWQPDRRQSGLAGRGLPELPLYGSERLVTWPTDAPIVITEGEKAADSLVAAGIPALGTVTGASATPGPAALAVLAGRTVILWPDNDAAGRRHMQRLGAALQGVAAAMRWYAWPGAPAGGDAADFVGAPERAEIVRVVLEYGAPDWTPEPDIDDGPPGRSGHGACPGCADRDRHIKALESLHHVQAQLVANPNVRPTTKLVALRAATLTASRYRPEAPEAPIKLPVYQLAEDTGLSRQTVAAALNDLEASGVYQMHRIGYRDEETREPRAMLHVVPAAPRDDDEARLAPAARFTLAAHVRARPRPAPAPRPASTTPPAPTAAPEPAPLPDAVLDCACDVCDPATDVRVEVSCAGCGQVLVTRKLPANRVMLKILTLASESSDTTDPTDLEGRARRVDGLRNVPTAPRQFADPPSFVTLGAR